MKLKNGYTVLQVAVLVIMYVTLLSRSVTYAEEQANNDMITAEGWQYLIDNQFSQKIKDLIAYRETLNIPKEEMFNNGKAGMTWEEFKNLPRRELTDEEITGLQKALEERKKVVEHGPSLGDQFGNPTGTNNFDYTNALWGDILVVHDGNAAWGYFRHAGMYDKDLDFPGGYPIIHSTPADGVHHVPEEVFKHYDVQVGLKPSSDGYVAINANRNARTHNGKSYNWTFNHKEYTNSFYCSSLVWRSYYDAGRDIDSNGGGFVSPDDIYYSDWLIAWQYAY